MSPSILLDTCAALWAAADELSEEAATALSRASGAGARTYVSPITAWEIGVLARKGRFRSPMSPERWFERLMRTPGLELAEMPPEVLIASSFLPDFVHDDPADRIIVATAREYGLAIMTRDRMLLDYGAQGYVSVLSC
ncbi:MAG TPA: type II toxin-antitoxin system VapC family toxin [Caulobacterales bacterium]|nr:type II toxin-antitoxin system VapC family toxin [Caulobacterales bacterium]